MTHNIREDAIRSLVHFLRRARDWQDGQDYLSNHDVFGPWIAESDDEIALCQSLIREAEERLGDDLPY